MMTYIVYVRANNKLQNVRPRQTSSHPTDRLSQYKLPRLANRSSAGLCAFGIVTQREN